MKVTDPPKFQGKAPKSLTDHFDATEKWLVANRVVEGLGISITDADGGGKQINANGSGTGAAGSPQGFWTIIQSSPGKVKVGPNHPLRLTQTMNDLAMITNIDSEFTPGTNKVLFIEIDYPGPTFTLKMDDRWSTYPLSYQDDGGTPPSITKGYYLIGYCAETDDTVAATLPGPTITLTDKSQIKVAQTCFAPLLMQFMNTGTGFVIQYPDPPSAPGPS